MTPRDPFPIGKHKGMSLTDIKAKEPSYVAWICDQDWFEEKFPEIYEYFCTGVTYTKPAEKEVMDSDDSMLDLMPDAFKRFWNLQYGKRLRVQGMHQYTALLRVACTTWNEAAEHYGKLPSIAAKLPFIPAKAPVPSILTQPLTPPPKPGFLPPPLSHIPAPKLTSDSDADRLPDEDDPSEEPPPF
jgi:hypothetical protein